MAESVLNNSGFQCYICFELMDGQIILCESGHSCCKGCSRKLKKCGICKKPIDKSRNFAMEKVIQNLMSTNQFYPNELHVKNVRQRKRSVTKKMSPILNCPHADCIFCDNNLLQHIEDSHYEHIIPFDFTSKITYDITKIKDYQFYLKPIDIGKIIFIVNIEHDQFEKVTIYMRHISEKPLKTRNFTFSVKKHIEDTKIQPYKYKFAQSVKSMVTSKSRIKSMKDSNERCFLHFSIHLH